MSDPSPPPLFTVRTAVILLLGLVIGGLAMTLSVLSHASPAAAGLVGMATAGGAIAFFHKTID